MTTPRLRITEIFHSIQGESTWSGLPCIFVRLTGCHLRCVWCDSEYTFTGGEWMTLDEIIETCEAFPPCDLVEVTGGEPLLQDEVHTLMTRLLDMGKTVLLETSGAKDVSRVDPRVHKIMDLKPPGSGEVEKNLWSNLDHLTPADEVKFVVRDRADYEWSRQVIRNHDLVGRVRQVLLSPSFGEQELEPLAKWILEDALPVRLQVQMHKFIWHPDTKGV